MKNILFINPPNIPFTSKGILIEPIDIIHLATFTKSLGYNVSFLDMDVKKIHPEFIHDFVDLNKIDIAVIVFDYHIPLHDEGTNQNIKKLLTILNDFKITSILGGKIASYYNEEKLKDWNADFFIHKEMETPLKNILSDLSSLPNNIRKKDKNTNIIISSDYKKNIINLNYFPFPDRSLCDLSDYIDVRTMLSSRGCNLKCTFCHVPEFWGNWNGKSPELVVQEINYLKKEFNAEKILFLDDNATAQPKRMKEISQLLLAQNNQTPLGCLGTIISFQEDVMQTMFNAGFRWIHYGVESGDEQQLISMQKKINPEKIKYVLEKTKNIGFRVRTSWIMDMPDLTEDAILNTEKMILENPTDEIRLHFLTLRLGSFLHNKFHIDTKQFIHNHKQNLNISGLDSQLISASVERIISSLLQKGYVLVSNPDDFLDVEKLKQQSPELKIVSLCPLRYGLGWSW